MRIDEHVNERFCLCGQDLPDPHGAPGRIRTCDPRLRRPLLYPAELRALDESFSLQTLLQRPLQLCCKEWSVRQDLNLRPLVPKTSALPSCATHRQCNCFRSVLPLCRYGVRILLTCPHLVKHFFK